jgi:lipopolysaccharide assembly outer membrane protein LptD (OstA)
VGYAVDRDAARYFGRFRSYYLHDSGDEDKNDQPIEDRDRGRVRLQHRHELPFAVEGTFEISYLSDRNFLSEFFEREAKTGKEQETVAYAKRIFADQAVTALGKWRINDFQTTTEYLPQIGYQAFSKPLLPGSPLGTNLYYSNETQIANVRFRPSEDLPDDEADSRRTTRIDSRHQLNVPLSLGDFHLNPFVEGRYTHYEEPLDPDAQGDIARFAASSGFRLGTQAWRTYDADIRRLRVRGIRHVINPEIRYVNRWAATQSPESLIQFDEVDAVRKLQFLELSMRNRLQTRGGAQVRTFVDWRTANRYFPDAARDNDGDPWGNLENDVRARLSERLLVFWDSEYDWYAHGFAVMNTGLRLVPSEDVRIILAHRFLRDRASIVTAGVEYRLSRKWAVEMLEQVDTKSGRELESRVVLQRHTHDWVFEFTLSADRNEGDTRVSVAVYPRELYQGARQRRRFDREPFLERGPIFGLDRD